MRFFLDKVIQEEGFHLIFYISYNSDLIQNRKT
jgi:hypothetical protein